MNRELLNEITRQRNLIKKLNNLNEATTPKNPWLYLYELCESGLRRGKVLGDVFTEDIITKLKSRDINTIDDLKRALRGQDIDDNATALIKRGDIPAPKTKIDDIIEDMFDKSVSKIFNDPEMDEVAYDVIGEYFNFRINQQAKAAVDLILTLDPKIPAQKQKLDQFIAGLSNENFLGKEHPITRYFERQYSNKMKEPTGSPKVDTDTPTPPKVDTDTPTPPKTDDVDETPITPDDFSEEAIENFTTKMTTDDEVTQELATMSQSELVVKSKEVYERLKNKNLKDWDAKDHAYFTQLSEKKLFTELQMKQMMFETPGMMEYVEILKAWGEFKKSPQYKSQTSGVETTTTTVGGKTTTVVKQKKPQILTFEKYLQDNGYKNPSWFVRFGGNTVEYLDSVFGSYKLLPKYGEPGFQKAWLKFAFHWALLFSGVAAGVISFTRTGSEAALDYFSNLTGVKDEELKKAIDEFFNYRHPKVGDVDIYGGVDLAANSAFQDSPPIATIRNREEGIIELSNEISVNGKKYKFFKVNLSKNILKSLPIPKGMSPQHSLSIYDPTQISNTSTGNNMTKKEVEDFLTSPTEGWVKPLKFDPDLDNQTSYKVTDSDNPPTTGTITKVNGKLTIK